MKKLLFICSILLLISMLLPTYLVSADKKSSDFTSMIGVSQVKDNNVDVTYTGRHFKDSSGHENYEYSARIYATPVYTDNGTPVDNSWHYSNGSYFIINNVFSATVIGAAITTTYQGETLSWNPVVRINSKEYTAKGNPNKSSKINYQNNILEWDYSVCIRRITVTEGQLKEEWIFDKNPNGTVWIKDNAVKSAGFVWAVQPYAYDKNGSSLVINQYKQVMASEFDRAVYPVVIDPTVSYSTTSSDYSYDSGAGIWVWNTAWATTSGVGNPYSQFMELGTALSGAYYYALRAFVYFDTSFIPDSANITAASLNLYGYQDYSATDFDITIQNGQPTYPHNPSIAADFNKVYYSGDGGNKNTSTFVTSGYNNISLNTTGISWISKIDITKLCLRSSQDIAGIEPTDMRFVKIYAYEQGVSYQPYLSVTYIANAAPVVIINPATYITKFSARLNGYLSDDGGEFCNVSFLYAFWNGSSWETNSSTSNQSKTTGDSFYADISSLTNQSTYQFMVVATNGFGTTYSSWLNFSTLDTISPPNDILCSADSNSIVVSWAKVDSSQVYIRYKQWAYPTSSTDGYAVANQSGNSYTQTGLSTGTSYYFRLWGLEDGNLSATNSTTMCTTTAGGISSTPGLLPTPNMSGATTAPNGSALSNNPLYGLGNLEAAAISVPQGTWWMLVGMGGLVVTGLFIYTRSRNLLAALGAMIIFGVIMTQMGLFPIWTMYVFGLAGIGMSWKELR